MKLCPNRSAAEEHSLKRGLLPSHGRIRRGPEGSSRKVDVRRSWDPRVETTTGTPCLEEMPITNGRHHRLLRDSDASEVTAESITVIARPHAPTTREKRPKIAH